tara:strand:- start:58 stop:441 length:384 start_codon:yes stop_codon:yes gene_type:complete
MTLFLIGGCGSTTTEHVESDTHAEEPDYETEAGGTGEVKEFDIIARSWEFVPDTIEVNLGDKVELHIESIDVTHGFRLPEFNINERLEPYQGVDVEFIADKKGIFSFSCSVPCGSGHGGMRGQLIVK